MKSKKPLKDMLAANAEAWRALFAINGGKDTDGTFGSNRYALEFVANFGTDFVSAPFPTDLKRGGPRLCYMNAYNLATSTGLEYVEGYALSADLERVGMGAYPVEHAWCVDENGTVFDPTWDDPAASTYRGVIVPDDLLYAELDRLKRYGVLHSYCGTNMRLIEALRKRMTSPKKVLEGAVS